MSELFGAFPIGKVERVAVHSYTVGAGGHAQLTEVVLEVFERGAAEPVLIPFDYGDEGPTLAGLQSSLREVNRDLDRYWSQGDA